MEITLLLLYLAIAIGFSFLCSIAEAVLLSVTPSFLAERRQEETASAKRIIRLKENIDRPLAAILSLNTIAHTVGAAGVGAQATKVYGDQYVGVISAVLTLLILVFSEIIPKTIGALHWRRLAGPVAWLIDWLIVFMLPLVWLSEFVTKLLSGSKEQELVTRAEIAAVAELGATGGQLRGHETKILRNLLRMEQVTVEDVMTPSTVVIALEQSQQVSDVAGQVPELPVSRIPLYDKQRDHCTGFVLRSDLLNAIATGETDRPLNTFSRPLLAIEEDESITVAFELLLAERAHIAKVVDKFGGFEGIVTLEDVLETLLGLEIVDEYDQTVDMRKLAQEKWQQRSERQGLSKSES